MRRSAVAAIAAILCASSAADAAKPGCPVFEPGARYPWQSNEIMRGDQFAWLELDVNRAGYPFRCRVGKNNFPDPETGFWLCKSWRDRWRAPPAAAGDPDTRTFKRYSLIAGYDHARADNRARKQWFVDNPQERPECYPEPTRPDRLG